MQFFYSTNLNHYIASYAGLADRIARTLGAPIINIELHQDQVYENIAIALEMFSKYSGYTREALVFDSAIYESGRGIRMDALYTLSNTIKYWRNDRNQNPGSMYNICNMVLGDKYDPFKAQAPGVRGEKFPFAELSNMTIVMNQEGQYMRAANVNDFELLNTYDYLINDYRKVLSVSNFEEGYSGGLNTLFTIEQTLAQQSYYSYALGNFGFDLVSWYALKTMLKDREKLLAQRKRIDFDKRTQYMRIWPEPIPSQRFYGVVECFVERPIQDLLKEEWVYKYALALCKVTLGYIRGKYTGISLAGQVSISVDIGQQGITERDKLEEDLRTGANAGYGDHVATFLIG